MNPSGKQEVLPSLRRTLLRFAAGFAAAGAGLVLFITGGFLAIGFGAFFLGRATGNDRWVENFFRVPGAFLLVSLAIVEVSFSLRVLHEFSPGQPMRNAWWLIAFASA